MSTEDTPTNPAPEPTGPRSRRRRLAIAASGLVALIAVIGMLVGHQGSRHAAATGDPATSPALSSSQTTTSTAATSPAPATRAITHHPSASTVRPKPARTTATPAPAASQGNPGTAPGSSQVPAPVTTPTVHSPAPAPDPVRHSTPAPQPRPTPKPTPYTPHFVSVGKPAAFNGIPQGGAAQSGVVACVQQGECGGFGLQWGGSCSMPPYAGDTAGAKFSGWAMWQRGPGDCTWAMAVSAW